MSNKVAAIIVAAAAVAAAAFILTRPSPSPKSEKDEQRTKQRIPRAEAEESVDKIVSNGSKYVSNVTDTTKSKITDDAKTTTAGGQSSVDKAESQKQKPSPELVHPNSNLDSSQVSDENDKSTSNITNVLPNVQNDNKQKTNKSTQRTPTVIESSPGTIDGPPNVAAILKAKAAAKKKGSKSPSKKSNAAAVAAREMQSAPTLGKKKKKKKNRN